MKKFILLFLMLMCMASVCLAQTCRDKNNMTVGKIESDGTVRNARNMKIGSIDGKTIRDARNMKIGTVDRNGTVRDKSNMKIGSVSGVDPTYAAVLFFFDLL
ncbi:MAG: hypothetical protein SPK71_05560 [Prevotella sp.]|nr:hypothetical protein [Prevotella sp.]